jgi:hypothetical protein
LSFRRTFFLLAVLSAGIFYAYKYEYIPEQKKETAEKERKKILDIKPADVTKLVVTVERESVEITRDKRGWKITSPVKTAADNAAIDRLVSSVADMSLDEILTGAAKNPSDFHLQPPFAKVEFFTGSSSPPRTVSVGNYTPTMRQVYGASSRVKGLFTAPVGLMHAMVKKLFDLREKRIFPAEGKRVSALEYERGGRIIKMKRTRQGDWRISSPVIGRADREKADDFVKTLLNARASGFIDEPMDDKEAGLSPPAAKITFRFTDQSPPFSLLVGAKDEVEKGVIVKPAGISGLMLLPLAFFDALPSRAEDFLDRHIFDIPENLVWKLSVMWGDMLVELEKPEGRWMMLKPLRKRVESEKVDPIVSALLNMEYVGKATAGTAGKSKLASVLLASLDGNRKIYLDIFEYGKDKNLLFGRVRGGGDYLLNKTVLNEISIKKLEELAK